MLGNFYSKKSPYQIQLSLLWPHGCNILAYTKGCIMLTTQINTDLPFNYFRQLPNTVATAINKGIKKTKRILIIEDDADMADLLRRSLKTKYNCIATTAQDPFEAMNMITEKFYDLIILDWQLPGLNGAETLIQAEKGLAIDPAMPIQWDQNRVPVVVFSSTKKNECLVKKTKHFNYAGYVSKLQSISSIVEAFGDFINQKSEVTYLSA